MKLSELKKMATENGISLKHLTGKMLKKSELAEKLMTKGVMVKSPKKSRKTSRKPKKTSRKPKKTSRKPVKKSRKPKKVRKYKVRTTTTNVKRRSKRVLEADNKKTIKDMLKNVEEAGKRVRETGKLPYIDPSIAHLRGRGETSSATETDPQSLGRPGAFGKPTLLDKDRTRTMTNNRF